jgi:hypothetical protein
MKGEVQVGKWAEDRSKKTPVSPVAQRLFPTLRRALRYLGFVRYNSLVIERPDKSSAGPAYVSSSYMLAVHMISCVSCLGSP